MPGPPSSPKSRLLPMLVLGTIVIASATQTELTSYVGKEKGYSKPYFTFYLTHSIFTIIFPLHLLILQIIRPKVKIRTYTEGLRDVISDQLNMANARLDELGWRFGKTLLSLTALISIPALCWYSAVPLTGTTDVTTIYATATFWTYGFSLLLLKTPLQRNIIVAVCVAFAGVVLITYAGVEEERQDGGDAIAGSVTKAKGQEEDKIPSHRILGDLIMLTGAIVLGLYEVIYKRSLPEGHGGVESGNTKAGESAISSGYFAIEGPEEENLDNDNDTEAGLRGAGQLDGDIPTRLPPPSITPQPRPSSRRSRPFLQPFAGKPISRPPLPPALHANFLTSCIGIATLSLFWLPIPILSILGLEHWETPTTDILPFLVVITFSGSVYNAGFMCLIGMLGPITASVANLLVIGLVAVVDAVVFGQRIPLWTLVGAGLVCVGFGVLLFTGEGAGEERKDVVEEEPMSPIATMG